MEVISSWGKGRGWKNFEALGSKSLGCLEGIVRNMNVKRNFGNGSKK